MKSITMIAIILLTGLSGISNIQSGGDDIVGVWLTGSKDGKVTIFKTGNYYYGKISWLRVPLNESGKPKTDIHNHNVELQGKPLLGLLILKSFTYDAIDNVWKDGTIYDPKNGKTYSCKMELTNANTLEVRGYIGISMVGRTDTWTKVE